MPDIALGTAVVSLCVASMAQACLPPLVTTADLLANKRVRQAQDCSYRHGGVLDDGVGEAAQDVGNGRVMQRIMVDKVVLTDCTAKAAALVLGKADPAKETTCGPHYELQRFEGAGGPLDYSSGADLADFAAMVGRSGFVVVQKPRLNQGEARKDVVDYFCGCKRFYPESAAARD
jgi:hypothetical protein